MTHPTLRPPCTNANGDAPEVADQFVELINVTAAPLAMEGWSLTVKAGAPAARHTFAAGTTLAAGKVLVVFGGEHAKDDDAQVTYVAATGGSVGMFGLGLIAAGNLVQVLDGAGDVVARFAYGSEGGPAYLGDKSLTRAQDGGAAAAWIEHPAIEVAEQDEVFFSPGRRSDGSAFGD